MGNYTILEAADKWISMIEAPENTKATAEQKAALAAQIRAAAPKTIGTVYGVGRMKITASSKLNFTDAANAIKNTLKGQAA